MPAAATAIHQVFDAPDWRLVRDTADQRPDRRIAINRLMDEMDAYEKAVFAANRGQIVTIPERPNLTLRLAEITAAPPS